MLSRLAQKILMIVLIISLILVGCTQASVQINNITYDPDITFLDLSGTELDKEDIKQLGKLKKLEILDLSNAKIDDLEGIEKLTDLEEINLNNTYISYYTIEDTLCRLKNLKKADFTDSSIGMSYDQMKKLHDKFPSADITPSLEDALCDNISIFNSEAKLCHTLVMMYLGKCSEELPSGIYTGELTYRGELSYDYIPKGGSDGLNEWLCLNLLYGVTPENTKVYGYYSIIVKNNAVVSSFYSNNEKLLNETEPLKVLACTSDYIVGGCPEEGVIDWIAEGEKGE